MQPIDILDKVLGNTIKVRILRRLACGFDGQTGRALARMISVSSPAVLGPLQELVSQGILVRTIVGKSHTYRLNRPNILVNRGLIPLFRLESELLQKLGAFLEKKLPRKVETAVLYGSIARGEAGPDSDWDILLLCSSAKVAKKMNNELPDKTTGWDLYFSSPLDIKVMTTAEFRKKFKAGDRFARNIYQDYLDSRVSNPLFGKSLTELLGK